MGVVTARELGLHGRGMELVNISIVFTSIAFALVLARVSTRLKMSSKLGWDDCCICASMVGYISIGARHWISCG